MSAFLKMLFTSIGLPLIREAFVKLTDLIKREYAIKKASREIKKKVPEKPTKSDFDNLS